MGTIIGSGLVGAFAVSLLFMTWSGLFHPRMLGDGQYSMVFLFTSPSGWLMCSIIGTVLAVASQATRKPNHPDLTSTGIVIGGTILIPTPGMIFMIAFCSLIGSILEIFRRLLAREKPRACGSMVPTRSRIGTAVS
ncbi:MAG: hypothetical protein C4320_04115 [Armatimonadota bacterium]